VEVADADAIWGFAAPLHADYREILNRALIHGKRIQDYFHLQPNE
jgi:hypothetical protein